jgi:hypothetical protein
MVPSGGTLPFAVADRSQHMPGTWAKDQGEYADGVSAPYVTKALTGNALAPKKPFRTQILFSVVVLDRPSVSG